MRHFLLAGLAIPLMALPALAQTTPSTSPTTGTTTTAPVTTTHPAVTNPAHTDAAASTGTQASAGGLAGANSFTEGQARSRLEKDGFGNVSALAKDKDGVWRGQASKGSQTQNVGVDYKGNIIAN